MINALYQLLSYKLGLMSGAAVLLQIIRKEKHFEDGKHDK